MEKLSRQKALWLLTLIAMSQRASSQGPTNGLRDNKGGLISEKTKMKFSEAHIEDITNDNFPDLIESFDYPNADIADVIKAISELTGKNFIVDPGVRGKITIVAPSQITVAEAYKAFLSALAINSMTVIPGDGFLKIKTARNAQRDSIETYSGAYYPTSDIMITRIVKLKYVSAEEVNKNLRPLLASTNGEIFAYPATNSLIISDFGSNVDRIMKILNQLDIPGFEEQLEVIRIRYAKAKDLADLLDQIITKGEGRQGGAGGAFGGVPRFRRATSPEGGGTTSGAENYSLVLPDERTNSIIVVGNQAGIEKIRKLVGRLDFRLRPEEAGGVYVYYVRNSEADKIADTLNGIASESKKSADSPTGAKAGTGAVPVGPSANVIFGGDVKVTADKITNSLIITASKPDYEVVKSLLSKIDIARDQVFIKTVIMELGATAKTVWGLNYYNFAKDTNGIGRVGFRGSDSLAGLIDPSNDNGAILGFGTGGLVKVNIGTTPVEISSFAGMLNFFKANAQGNVLSEPTIMALDNEEAEIEVGEKVPVGTTQTATGATTSVSTERQPATIKLVITPYISPDSDAVQMKLKQTIDDVSTRQIQAADLAKAAVSLSTRTIKTQIVVNSGDTAVLGGLMQDKDSESVTKIPILGDIPILGWLFKSKKVDKEKRNLMVFITPKIVRNAEDNANILNQKLNERIEFIQRGLNGRDPFGEAIDNLPRRAQKEESQNQFNNEPASESF